MADSSNSSLYFRPSEIVIDSYNHFVNDLGKTPTLDDIEEDILSSYDDAYDYFKGNDSAEEASKDIKYIKSILRKEGLKYNDELEESAKLKEVCCDYGFECG